VSSGSFGLSGSEFVLHMTLETLFYVALGFFSALIIMIPILKLLWDRAVRLTERDILRRLPSTSKEVEALISAERADYAVRNCMMEKRLKTLEEKEARLKIENGHLVSTQRAAIADRQAVLDRLEDAQDDIQNLKNQLNGRDEIITALKMEGRELERRLNNAKDHMERQTIEINEYKTRLKTLQDEWGEKRDSLLQTQAESEQFIREHLGDKATLPDSEVHNDEAMRLKAQNMFLKGQLAEAEGQLTQVEDSLFETRKALQLLKKDYDVLHQSFSEKKDDEDELPVMSPEAVSDYEAEIDRLKQETKVLELKNQELHHEVRSYRQLVTQKSKGKDAPHNLLKVIEDLAVDLTATLSETPEGEKINAILDNASSDKGLLSRIKKARQGKQQEQSEQENAPQLPFALDEQSAAS
jgi:chromosome segregation ATPase